MLTLLRRLSTLPLSTYARSVPASFLVAFAICGVLMGILVKPWTPTYMLGQGRLGGIVIWILLLLVARALARGKRHAWLLSVGLLTLLGAFSFQNRSVRILFPLILALFLAFVMLAPLFRTRSDPRALLRGYASLVVGSAALYGHRAIYGLLRPAIPQPYGLLFLVRVVAFLLLAIGVIEILRPVLPRHVLSSTDSTSSESVRTRAIVKRYGRHSLAHYTLGENLSYFWAESGEAFLAYRVCQGVAVMLGDPIGRDEELAALLQQFQKFCHRLDWDFAIYQASPTTLVYLASGDIHAVKVGEEAIVDTATFTLQGRIGAPVRHAIARARRDNVTVSIWHGETIPESIFAGMKQVSTAWLHTQHTYTQMGFSMGRFPADWSPELLTAVALNYNGAVVAFLTWTPLYQGNGWTLDNMRRVEQTPPGTMEYLIAESMEWACVRGFRSMSLSLAPMAGLDEEVRGINERLTPHWRISSSARLLQRSAAYLHRRGLLLGNYRSLYFFKHKFQPIWQPRYLVLTDASALPRVLIALAVVHGMGWQTAIRDLRASVSLSRSLRHEPLHSVVDTPR